MHSQRGPDRAIRFWQSRAVVAACGARLSAPPNWYCIGSRGEPLSPTMLLQNNDKMVLSGRTSGSQGATRKGRILLPRVAAANPEALPARDRRMPLTPADAFLAGHG